MFSVSKRRPSASKANFCFCSSDNCLFLKLFIDSTVRGSFSTISVIRELRASKSYPMWRIFIELNCSSAITNPLLQTKRNRPAWKVNAFLPSCELVNRIRGKTVSPSAPLITISGLANTNICFWKPWFLRALISLASTTFQPNTAISSKTRSVGMCEYLSETVLAPVFVNTLGATCLTCSLLNDSMVFKFANITLILIVLCFLCLH